MNYLIIDNDDTAIATIDNVLKNIHRVNTIHYCRDSKSILTSLNDIHFNVVFIDPELVAESQKAKVLEALESIPYIILMSSKAALAKDAYDMGARDFLQKPLSLPRLMRSISKIATTRSVRTKEVNTNKDHFFVKHKGTLVKVFASEIYLIEGLADYVNIYTSSAKYTIHSTMKHMEAVLGGLNFIRVHKSYIVRIDCIQAIENKTVIINDKSIPLSKNYKKELLNRLKII